MRSKLILPAFLLTAALGLACGGGDTTTTTTTLSEDGDLSQNTSIRPAADAVVGTVSGEALGKWGDPMAETKKRLGTLGWSVDSCDMYKDSGEVYYNCSATKGQLWADVDISDLSDTQDAKWLAEDNPAAKRDGKRVLEVTVFDGGAGKTLGEMILPSGKKMDTLDMSAASKILQSKGWDIEEQSSSSSGGYTSMEMIGIKGGNVLVVEADMEDGAKLSRDERSIEEGMFFVQQADESFFTVAVLDEAQGTKLLKSLLGS